MFEQALAALGELLGEDGAGDPAQHEISASAPDRPVLLAEWLSELVFLAETEEFVPERVARFELRGDTLDALVDGRRGHPPHLVKAVTYHRLSFSEERGAWHATVVFDV